MSDERVGKPEGEFLIKYSSGFKQARLLIISREIGPFLTSSAREVQDREQLGEWSMIVHLDSTYDE